MEKGGKQKTKNDEKFRTPKGKKKHNKSIPLRFDPRTKRDEE